MILSYIIDQNLFTHELLRIPAGNVSLLLLDYLRCLNRYYFQELSGHKKQTPRTKRYVSTKQIKSTTKTNMAQRKATSFPMHAIIGMLALFVSVTEADRSSLQGEDQAALRELSDQHSSLLHFVAIGDWGASISSPQAVKRQRAVADGIASVLGKKSSEADPFVLSVGDNFYPSGLSGSEEEIASRFSQTFEQVYNHDEFDNVPWYIIAGNRDYEGDMDAQIRYGQSESSRWVFPDYFHQIVREVNVPGSNTATDTIKVEIIAIDTMKLTNVGAFSSKISKTQRALSQTMDEEALRWIEHRLSNSDADYLLVAGHFPVYEATSVGEVHKLEKLLTKYDVSAYLAGHIHCQEHIVIDGVNYFIAGTGMEISCESEGEEEIPSGYGIKYLLTDTINPTGAVGGFLSFDVTFDKMVARFHSESGSVLYETVIAPRN